MFYKEKKKQLHLNKKKQNKKQNSMFIYNKRNVHIIVYLKHENLFDQNGILV